MLGEWNVEVWEHLRIEGPPDGRWVQFSQARCRHEAFDLVGPPTAPGLTEMRFRIVGPDGEAYIVHARRGVE